MHSPGRVNVQAADITCGMGTSLTVARFDLVQLLHEARQLVPFVDGMAFAELAGTFEMERGYVPAGAHSGPILDHFNFGDLERYLLGQADSDWSGDGRVALLGCGDCGDVGCWPLLARVQIADSRVCWDQFGQPYRPGWDYSGFGPFLFQETQYRDAVAQVVAAVDAQPPAD